MRTRRNPPTRTLQRISRATPAAGDRRALPPALPLSRPSLSHQLVPVLPAPAFAPSALPVLSWRTIFHMNIKRMLTSRKNCPLLKRFVHSRACLPRPWFILPTFKSKVGWQRVTAPIHAARFLYTATFHWGLIAPPQDRIPCCMVVGLRFIHSFESSQGTSTASKATVSASASPTVSAAAPRGRGRGRQRHLAAAPAVAAAEGTAPRPSERLQRRVSGTAAAKTKFPRNFIWDHLSGFKFY